MKPSHALFFLSGVVSVVSYDANSIGMIWMAIALIAVSFWLTAWE